MSFFQHKARAHCVSIKSPIMTLKEASATNVSYFSLIMRMNNRVESESKMWTYFPIKDHLVSFSVFDLVVEVLRQLQTLVNLSLKPNGALPKKRF